MDKKISEFPVATGVSATALIPIVNAGVNETLTIGVLSLNLPNFGNKGLTKNLVVAATVAAIPVTAALVTLPLSVTPYTLAAGTDGQEICLVSLDTNTVTSPASYFTSILLGSGSSITLMYIASISKWIPKSYHNATLT
jgi:hypothetical protein